VEWLSKIDLKTAYTMLILPVVSLAYFKYVKTPIANLTRIVEDNSSSIKSGKSSTGDSIELIQEKIKSNSNDIDSINSNRIKESMRDEQTKEIMEKMEKSIQTILAEISNLQQEKASSEKTDRKIDLIKDDIGKLQLDIREIQTLIK